MGKKVRVGIIGTGGIASWAHIPNYQKQPDCEIVAACDVSEEARRKASEKFGIPNLYEDFRDLAADPDVDAVSVCTPNFMHRDPTVACLEAGKHVLVEKPIARNAQEGAAMVRAAKEHNKILAVGLHYRYKSGVQALRRFRDSGGFGDIYFTRVHAIRRRGIPSWGVFGDKEKQGGGPLIDLGVHILYAALYVLGFPRPATVSGVTYTKIGNKPPGPSPWGAWDHKSFTVEDYAAALVRFEDGASMLIESSFASNQEQSFNFWVLGDKGGAQYDPCTIYREEFGTLTNTTPGWLPKDENHEGEIRDFVNAVRGEGEVGVTGEQGLLVTQILDGIYQSAESGREVQIEKIEF